MLVYLQVIETPEDTSKFEEIYTAYKGLMYYVAFKYLRHEQEAEDAVHYAFVKIAENIKIIEPVSPKTKQLVVTIVEHRAIDVLRSRRRHPNVAFIHEVQGGFLQAMPEDDLLSACIKKLPPQQRTVIWLKYHYGYDLREISKLLGISLFWAQKIDQRAKKKLKELYLEEGGVL